MKIDPLANAGGGAPAAVAVIEAVGLTRHFDVSAPWLDRLVGRGTRRTLRAVEDVSFAVEGGRTFALVGESGCGKSTLARMVVGLQRPTAGTIRFRGIDLAALRGRPRYQMIFQDPYASLDPRWRAGDAIAEPIRLQRLLPAAQIGPRVDRLLSLVGLSPRDRDRYPHEFSGGQRQRISIARALAAEPELLVCDEPTSALDVSVQAQILNLLEDLQQEFGLSYLFISHNLAVIHHVADEVAVMYLGRIVEQAPAVELFAHPRHPYTRMLLDAIPDLDMQRRSRARPAGEMASAADVPPGCAFHPRCPHATERCRSERPVRRTLASVSAVSVACHAIEEGRLQ